MANNIIVNTATIRNKAGELKTLNNRFRQQVEQLKTQEASLNAMWDGDANDSCHTEFHRDAVQMNNFYNAIEKYVQSLQEIAEVYEAAERRNVQIAKERTYR